MPRCNLCGAESNVIIALNESFPVLQCKVCLLVYVYPQPDNSEIKREYDDDLIFSSKESKNWLKHCEKDLARLWLRRISKITKFKNTGKILDVGCGTGDFVKHLAPSVWKVYGTEYSPQMARVAQDRCRIDVFIGFLKQAQYENESFDAVTMWHVLEHVPDPSSEIREIFRILRKGGLIVIEVPNLNFILKKSYKMPLSRNMHLTHFTASTLSKMLADNGFKVRLIESTHTGFFREQSLKAFIKIIIHYTSKITVRLFGLHIDQAILIIAEK